MTLPVLVPLAFWAVYHWYKDRHLPEPPGHLLIALLLGLAAYWLGVVGYTLLGFAGLRIDALALAAEPARLFAYALFVIGPIEEAAKLLPFLLVILRFEEFDEPIDGIIYASFIGLGFSLLENLQYLAFLSPLEALARGFAGPVVHVLLASIWGYIIGLAHMRGQSISVAAIKGFVLAALLHGVYDFLVLWEPGTALPIAALLIGAVWIWRLRLLRDLHDAAVAAGAPGDADH